MTDKELQKLKRSDLIEILYYMRQEIDELREENEKLTSRLDKLVGEAISKSNEKITADSEDTAESDVKDNNQNKSNKKNKKK